MIRAEELKPRRRHQRSLSAPMVLSSGPHAPIGPPIPVLGLAQPQPQVQPQPHIEPQVQPLNEQPQPQLQPPPQLQADPPLRRQAPLLNPEPFPVLQPEPEQHRVAQPNVLALEQEPIQRDPLPERQPPRLLAEHVINENYVRPPEPDERQQLLRPHRRQPSRWERFKGWVTSFFTANTPGPYTGIFGGASAATSFAGGKPFEQSVNALKVAKSGTAFSSAMMATDVLGLYGALKDYGQGSRAATEGANALERYEGRSQADRGKADAAVIGTDLLLSQTPSAVNAGLQTAGTSLTWLGALGGVGGSVVNTAVAARSSVRAGRALGHWWRGGNVAERHNLARNSETRAAMQYHQSQMKSRGVRHTFGAVGAATGAIGGALATAALLGAAVTPIVGWALLGAAGLAALGLGAYKLVRWFQKRKAKTLGTERRGHAAALVEAVQRDGDDAEKVAAYDLLSTSFGQEYADNVVASRGDQKDSAIDSVARKIHGW